jgi:hypothetical protein
LAGDAERVTVDPAGSDALHEAPHAIPGGVLVTVPRPLVVTTSGNAEGPSTNRAVTTRGAPIVNAQVLAVPVQDPVHPANTHPAAGAAVSVTMLPLRKPAVQVTPHVIPAGALVTAPLPSTETASGWDVAPPNEAVTPRSPSTLTTHVRPVPEHTPPHPRNDEPGSGVAVRVTCVPRSNGALHAPPQSMPEGDEVTRPFPARATVRSWRGGGGGENVAVTDFGPLIESPQEPVPEHAPLQPPNDQPAAGVAESVTLLPVSKLAEHDEPQSIPPGELVTVPSPLFATATGYDDAGMRVKVAVTP